VTQVAACRDARYRRHADGLKNIDVSNLPSWILIRPFNAPGARRSEVD
jgi:hypothetical protein